MISQIRGILQEQKEDRVVVETGGIGFEVRVPTTVISNLPPMNTETLLYTHMQMREDGVTLYGFETGEQREFFRLLLGVSGIGPKGALGILSVLSPNDLRFAILSDDAKTLAKAPGLGIKTAKKLILELKDRIDLDEVIETNTEKEEIYVRTSAGDEVLEALVALGYSSSEALKAIRSLGDIGERSAEELIRLALKQMI